MKKFAVAVLFAVFVMGAAATVSPAYAAENLFQRVSNSFLSRLRRVTYMLPGDKSGQDVMAEAMRAGSTVKSGEINAQMNFELLEDTTSLAKMKVGMVGPFSAENPMDLKTRKQALTVDGEVSMQGTTLKAQAEMKMIGEKVYFKLNELPALPNFNAGSLKGTWYVADSKTGASTSELTAEDMAKLNDAANKLMRDSQLSSARKDTKNGHAVFVIEATIPKKAVTEFVNTAVTITSKSNPTTAESSEMVVASLEKMMENVGEMKATFWIDRGSFLTRHVELPLVITLPKSESGMSPASAGNPLAALGNANKVLFTMIVDTDKFNQSFDVTEPTGAEDFSKAIMGMMGGAGVGAMPSEAPSELPAGLTPKQMNELEQYQKMSNDSQKIKELQDKVKMIEQNTEF